MKSKVLLFFAPGFVSMTLMMFLIEEASWVFYAWWALNGVGTIVGLLMKNRDDSFGIF